MIAWIYGSTLSFLPVYLFNGNMIVVGLSPTTSITPGPSSYRYPGTTMDKAWRLYCKIYDAL